MDKTVNTTSNVIVDGIKARYDYLNKKAVTLREQLETAKTDKTSSAANTNTLQHRVYSAEREAEIMYVVWKLSDTVKTAFSELDKELQVSLEKLAKPVGATPTSVVVKEGDDLMELLTKYADTKDVYKKIMAACTKNGLKIEGTKIVAQ